MKNIFKTLMVSGLVLGLASCNKYLDINTNPNSPTSSTPELVLPGALATTGSLTQSFNVYGAQLGGVMANAGGYSGFGNLYSNQWANTDFTGLWSGSYDNINDYQYVIKNTTATGDYKYFNAIARTMKALDFLRLVDAYGDVPYTQALQSAANVTPTYDKGQDVYKACLVQLDSAIAIFNTAPTLSTVKVSSTTVGPVDVTFNTATGKYLSYSSDKTKDGLVMTEWAKFANTIKLRALLRIQKVASMNSTFTSEKPAAGTAFLTSDVLINPGYQQISGKTNPQFSAYAYTVTGGNSQASIEPSSFAVGFYNGSKLTDGSPGTYSPASSLNLGRGNVVYRDYTTNNRVGVQGNTVPTSPTGGVWYTGSSTGVSAQGLGVLKGPLMGQPILTGAESYFLQAEGALIGYTSGSASALFDAGMLASFTYLDRDQNENVSSLRNPANELANYKVVNPASYLVNYNLATTDAQRLEAIITQKYIALNFINSDESWNEYRRTQYPVSLANGSAFTSMSSAVSLSTRADRLSGRILYPSTEYSYNAANVPANINTFTSLVFWDQRP